MAIFRYLRLGEILAIGWILFVAAVYTIFGQWRDFALLANYIQLPHLTIVLIAIICRYLAPIILISIKKLSTTVELLSPRESSSALVEIGFEKEADLFRSMTRFLRDCAPVFLFTVFYPSTDFLINCLQGSATVDSALIKIDEKIFHIHLSVWMERFISPGLSEVMSLCYFLHMLWPVVILLFICYYCDRSLFIEAVQGFMLISIIGFTLYILVPGVGPKYTLAHLYTKDLTGGFITDINRMIIDITRTPRDVFPSLHVGVSAIMLIYAWRANKWLGLFILPFTIGNWISTIYLRYHYTIDIVAAFILVFITYYAVQFWMRKFPVLEREESSVAEGKEITEQLSL